MNIIDSLSSNIEGANTAVAISENDLFNYNYNSVYKGINNSFSSNPEIRKQQIKETQELIISTLSLEEQLPFNLFALDITNMDRSHSPTLIDREFVHKPSSIFGQKPITLGHKYSILTFLKRDEITKHNWSIPFSTERVSSCSTESETAKKQINTLFNNCPEFNQDKLSVVTADSYYSNQYFLGDLTNYNNLVTITRSRCSRVFYTLPKIDNNQPKRRGHPQWYGNKFDLKDESTWHEVDEQFSTTITNHKDEIIELEIKCWHNLVMKGNKEQKMQQKPFNLLRITLKDKQGNLKFKPMWLIVMGKRKNDLSLFDCYQAYLRRFDIEHLFRFAKNKLLLNSYYSTNVERENNWVELVFLSYVNLWASRNLAQQVTPDWQKYHLKKMPDKITPSIVQRDYKRIICTFGTAVPLPKVRGYSSGRKKGTKLSPRLRYPTVKKMASKKKAS
ncbi:transposase [Geminocystis sp. GBBB08]|uniref:transposase n=1 Tax=Geminocystis sp. GBBB08 TaxID=2604140 RepID=UPI0027E34C01|nr:transposase [Geminocystis sp. GBBB08]